MSAALHSRVPAIAAALLATPQVRFYHDHVLVKEGRTRQRTPWHQDQPYYNVDGHGVSAWIPVDPVPEDGCLELVAGTHRGPWLMPRTFLTAEARWFPEGSLAELPDIDADRDGYDIRRFSLAPGDAIFFDFLTVHGAPGFPYDTRRRVLSLRYLSADVRHAPRAWRTSPPFDRLDAELPAGAPMDHPLFPVVWPGDRPGGLSRPAQRAIRSSSSASVVQVSSVSGVRSCGPWKSRTASRMSSRAQRIRYASTAAGLTGRPVSSV